MKSIPGKKNHSRYDIQSIKKTQRHLTSRQMRYLWAIKPARKRLKFTKIISNLMKEKELMKDHWQFYRFFINKKMLRENPGKWKRQEKKYLNKLTISLLKWWYLKYNFSIFLRTMFEWDILYVSLLSYLPLTNFCLMMEGLSLAYKLLLLEIVILSLSV